MCSRPLWARQVPETGKVPVPSTSPCTFVVTFARASGVVPISAGAFSVEDELGQVVHPKVSALGGGPLPREAPPGKSVTISISGALPIGAGQLRWAPEGGTSIVSWDFDVEID